MVFLEGGTFLPKNQTKSAPESMIRRMNAVKSPRRIASSVCHSSFTASKFPQDWNPTRWPILPNQTCSIVPWILCLDIYKYPKQSIYGISIENPARAAWTQSWPSLCNSAGPLALVGNSHLIMCVYTGISIYYIIYIYMCVSLYYIYTVYIFIYIYMYAQDT